MHTTGQHIKFILKMEPPGWASDPVGIDPGSILDQLAPKTLKREVKLYCSGGATCFLPRHMIENCEVQS